VTGVSRENLEEIKWCIFWSASSAYGGTCVASLGAVFVHTAGFSKVVLFDNGGCLESSLLLPQRFTHQHTE